MVRAAANHPRLPTLIVAGSMLFALRPASAQPAVDQLLADAQVAVQKGCAILKVNFSIRVRYASHFPLERGDELRITVNPIDRSQLAALALVTSRPEAATVPDGKLAGIRAIDLETRNPTGSVLRILFDRVATYKVAPDSDTHSIVVAIAGPLASATCQPVFPGARVRPDGPVGTMSDSDLRAVAAWMDEGRAALAHRNLGGAIQLFTRVLKYPENRYSAEALELLGVARQKGGQLGQARAAYEDYLARYPGGEERERVRQRLAGIVTALGGPSTPLHGSDGSPAGTPPIGRFAKTRETIWTLVGSASTFYIRDDSFRTVRDPSVAPDPNADPDEHAIHQNETFSTLDAAATWNNDQTKGRIRFSGGEEHRFASPNQTDETGVSALTVDTLMKDWDLNMVMGRQTLTADGMLGRFDGILLGWQALPMVKVDLVGGSPASSRYDVPFKNDRYFYGTAIHFGPLFGGLETSLYAIEQRDRWLVDREAIGADFRYVDLSKFVFGNVDYDIHFQRLNAAIFSGSWTLLDKSTIYGGADYRRTPYLSSWNALINQPFATLYDVLKFQAQDSQQVQQLAIDQTPIYKSAMLGFSHPLSDRLQVAADATIVSLTQPIPQTAPNSALLATLPAGTEYYYSAQLIGNNIMKEGDMYIGSLRYSQQPTLKEYVLDFNSRYPLTNDWLVSPRLRLGYAMGVGSDLKQYTVLPSLLVDYYWTRDLNFELEVGAQWTSAVQSGIKTRDTELLATIGVRYSFHTDNRTDNRTNSVDDNRKMPTPAASALCRYSARPDGGNCVSPSPGGR